MASNPSDGANDTRSLIEGLADDIQALDANTGGAEDTSDESARAKWAITEATKERASARIDRWLEGRPDGAASLGDVMAAAIATALERPRKQRKEACATKRGELLLVSNDAYAQKIFRLSIAPDFEITAVEVIGEALTRLTIGVRWAHVIIDMDTPDAPAFVQRALDHGARVALFSRRGVPVELLGRAFVLTYPLLIDEAREYLTAPPRARTTARA
jgi:hypothetical protein